MVEFSFNFYGCDLYFFRIKKILNSLYVCMYDPKIISQFEIIYF